LGFSAWYAACACATGPGLRSRDLQVGGIQFDQQVTLLHLLVVDHVDGRHRARHPRAHGADVPVDLRVVGLLEVAGVQPPRERGQRDHQQPEREAQAQRAFLACLGRSLFGGAPRSPAVLLPGVGPYTTFVGHLGRLGHAGTYPPAPSDAR